MADVHHESVFFTGRVQGVGFRYQTLQVAKGFEVNGWVQNLADGRVQLEVEGRQTEVAAFLQAIEEELDGFIRKIERAATSREAQLRGFTIR
ncbi:MAG: acylphosphatase [Candidatus Didemnitutus sp.]|nr:acylphosphatase [Candidatus Didemnitutus sp.]